jgi:hypothetical protein
MALDPCGGDGALHLDQLLARGCPHCGGPTGCLRQTSLRQATFKSGSGERIVFEPYSKEMFEQSFAWIATHAIFEPGSMGCGEYEHAIISLAAE